MADEQSKASGNAQSAALGSAASISAPGDYGPGGNAPNDEACAHVVFEVVPHVMQKIRAEMRRRRGPEISVLQLRALAYLRRNPGATLSSLAEHVGLTLPSMSSQVSGLVARNLIDRSVSTTDRRFVTLTLTEQGSSLLAAARQGTQESLAKSLATLAPDERAIVMVAMALLERVFAPQAPEAIAAEVLPEEYSGKTISA
jgi:DNA-binding MarR family transcriptional regulator